jgi:hypothetical protein
MIGVGFVREMQSNFLSSGGSAADCRNIKRCMVGVVIMCKQSGRIPSKNLEE